MSLLQTKISDLMTTNVVTIIGNDTADIAVRIFKENNFHHLPVLDESDKLIGMLSQTDINSISLGLTLFKNTDKEEYNKILFRTLRVKEIMSSDVIKLDKSEPLETAISIFKQNKIRAIPITENGKIVGLLSPLDILNLIK
jgi:CBS domain-containing protein